MSGFIFSYVLTAWDAFRENTNLPQPQRVTKKVHDQSELGEAYWSTLNCDQRINLGEALKEACYVAGLFIENDKNDLEHVMQWRLYQLHKNKAQKPKQGQCFLDMTATKRR